MLIVQCVFIHLVLGLSGTSNENGPYLVGTGLVLALIPGQKELSILGEVPVGQEGSMKLMAIMLILKFGHSCHIPFNSCKIRAEPPPQPLSHLSKDRIFSSIPLLLFSQQTINNLYA
jgi:hypothetical protein